MSKAALPALKAARKHEPVIVNITATLHYGATEYVGHASAAKVLYLFVFFFENPLLSHTFSFPFIRLVWTR